MVEHGPSSKSCHWEPPVSVKSTQKHKIQMETKKGQRAKRHKKPQKGKKEKEKEEIAEDKSKKSKNTTRIRHHD
jgi:hypothetical protein